MIWTVRVNLRVAKEIAKLPTDDRDTIADFLHKELPFMTNPRAKGEPLHGSLKSYWKYRFGNYRIVCEIKKSEILIDVITVGDRKEVYKHLKNR